MFGSFGLAVTAVAALALGAEDTRLLRLGIVAALWAALLGTFATARMRREISSSTDRVEELRTVYQLELEREIAARREHELTLERELREQLEQRQRAEIAALRAELQSLRGTLQHLLGGDVLVERVALRESTRLRPLPDHPRTVAATDVGEGRERRRDSFDSVSDTWSGAGLSAETGRTVGPAEPLRSRSAESERIRDTGFTDGSWSPAVSWTPSRVGTTVPSAGTAQDRRRRAESRPSLSGTQPSGWEPLGSFNRTVSPGPETDDNGPRAQVQSVGAHRGGRSVQELLAAYGESPTPRHRRRRRDDRS